MAFIISFKEAADDATQAPKASIVHGTRAEILEQLMSYEEMMEFRKRTAADRQDSSRKRARSARRARNIILNC